MDCFTPERVISVAAIVVSKNEEIRKVEYIIF